MKCLYCGKEIKDKAQFCNFCGNKQFPQTPPSEETAPPPLPIPEQVGVTTETSHTSFEKTNPVLVENYTPVFSGSPAPVSSEQAPKTSGKKRIGIIILLVFLLIALLSGSVLGFLTARGIISFEALTSRNNIKWTTISEERSESSDQEGSSKDSKKDTADTTSSEDEETD